MAEEAFDDAREFAALNNDGGAATAGLSSTSTPPKPLTINDLPKEILVSIFIAVGDQTAVRHTMPLVCKAWAELYRTKDASPLHETLEVDFYKEIKKVVNFYKEIKVVVSATREEEEKKEKEKEWWRVPYRPVVHASRVISWAERRAVSVRKLRVKGSVCFSDDEEEVFSAQDFSSLVAVVGSSLTEISVDFPPGDFQYGDYRSGKLIRKPFWESLRDFVVPAGRLRSFSVEGIGSDVTESDVEPLGQLAGSLEYLHLKTSTYGFEDWGAWPGLPRFPESFCNLTELRHLSVVGHRDITALPAAISSLKKLEDLDLRWCRLSSLPKELGELSRLTELNLCANETLGNELEGEAFPAELGEMKSLEYLNLCGCNLKFVPAFIGELESLEVLDLSENNGDIDETFDVLVNGCPNLYEVNLSAWMEDYGDRDPEWVENTEAFEARLLAKNPDVEVNY